MSLPANLALFIVQVGIVDQVWLSQMSITVALLDTAPIEILRRIINQSIRLGDFQAIMMLSFVYLGLVVCEGLTKLAMNIYRGWISENATLALRSSVNLHGDAGTVADARGVQAAMILSEADPIGGFVGESVSEPLLQFGTLVTVFIYLAYLNWQLAIISAFAFMPQILFVPAMQRAINGRVRDRIATLRAASAGTFDDHTEAIQILQEGRYEKIFQLDMGIIKLKYSLNFLMNITQHAGTVMILVLGGWLVVRGQIEVGTVVAFTTGLRTVTDPWGSLVNWWQNAWVNQTKYEMLRTALLALRPLPASSAAG